MLKPGSTGRSRPRMGRRWLWCLALSSSVLACSPHLSSGQQDPQALPPEHSRAGTPVLFSGAGHEYDAAFCREAKAHVPWAAELWGCLVLRDQGYQESLLRPDARSHVGAQGIMQVMPATWRELETTLGAGNPWDAATNIRFGTYYMRRMLRVWGISGRSAADRLRLAFASYNAGAGNLIKAQRLAGGARDYPPIIAALPGVTGRHARETTTYVIRIETWRRKRIGEGL